MTLHALLRPSSKSLFKHLEVVDTSLGGLLSRQPPPTCWRRPKIDRWVKLRSARTAQGGELALPTHQRHSLGAIARLEAGD